MPRQIQVDVKVTGPLFLPGVQQKVEEAVNDAVGDLVSEGERQVKLQLTPGHGLESGHYARSIHGEVTGSMHGIISDSNVVYGPWLEGVSSMNDRTRFKGYAMFRNAFQQLERIAGDILNKRMAQLVQRLGGS